MARRAEWRAGLGDPRTAWGWFLHDDRLRFLPAPLAFALAALAGAAALAGSPWTLLALPLLALHTRREKKPDLAQFVTLPPPGPAFAVRMEILRNGIVQGVDDGVLTFVGGWLHYAGRRTEFALSRDPARELNMGKALGSLVLASETVRFRPRRAWTSTDEFDDPDAVERGFSRTFAQWWHLPAPKGESTLPPREVHPSGLGRAWREAVAWVLVCIAVPGIIGALMRGQVWFLYLFAGRGGRPIGHLIEIRKQAKKERRVLPPGRGALSERAG